MGSGLNFVVGSQRAEVLPSDAGAESVRCPAPPIDSRLHKRTSFERCVGGYRYARPSVGFSDSLGCNTHRSMTFTFSILCEAHFIAVNKRQGVDLDGRVDTEGVFTDSVLLGSLFCRHKYAPSL